MNHKIIKFFISLVIFSFGLFLLSGCQIQHKYFSFEGGFNSEIKGEYEFKKIKNDEELHNFIYDYKVVSQVSHKLKRYKETKYFTNKYLLVFRFKNETISLRKYLQKAKIDNKIFEIKIDIYYDEWQAAAESQHGYIFEIDNYQEIDDYKVIIKKFN